MASIKRFDRQQDDGSAQHDQRGVDAEEHRRFFPIVADAAFPAERFAYRVGCGEGQDGGRKKRGIQQAQGEQNRGIFTGQRTQGQGGIFGAIDPRAGFEQGGRAGDHDERGHQDGEKRSDHHIDFLVVVILGLDAFVDNGRLLVELHPGRDGRADDGHENGHITGIQLKGGRDGCLKDFGPIRFGQKAGR